MKSLNSLRKFASGHGHEKGHGHHGHGHHEPFEVPHWTTYKNWTVAPELVAHQNRLHAIGLHDPWIRNFVWVYTPENRKNWGYPKFKRVFWGGIKYGVYTAVPLIVLTEAYMYYKRNYLKPHDHTQHHH